jgi:hypothetical protein
MGQVGNEFQSNDGRWHGSANAANDANLQLGAGASGGGGITNAGAGVMAGAAVLPILIALFLPRIIMWVFDRIVMGLLAIGTFGRVVLSLIIGLIFSGIALYHLQRNFEVFKFFGDTGLVALFLFSIFVVAVTVWVYCSHYFTLQGMLVKNIDKTGKISLFTKPFAIAFYGSIVTYIFYAIFKLPYSVFWIPLIACAIYYIYQSFSVRAAAKEEKKSIGLRPVGLIITIILAAVIPFGFTGIAAKVNADVNASGGFRTKLNEAKDGILILEYTGKDGNVVIPDTIKGLPVVEVSRLITSRTEVIIEQITFPNTLKIIDSISYTYESERKRINISSIVIPEGVMDIGRDVFSNCKNLTSVTLPRSLKRIGRSAFADCTSLTDVNIPSGCKISYGSNNDVFKGCSRLSPASRKAIQDSGYKGVF